jgi:hypothetical protein
MGNSYGLKGKGVDLSQGPPKRKRDVVQIPAAIETPLVPAENAPSSSGWHSNVALLLNFMMSFLCTIFSWAFPSKDIVRIPATIETPLVPAENAPSSHGWHSNVVPLLNLMMSFLCTVFSWAFPSYMSKFDFSLLFFILFGCVLTIFLDPYNHDSLLSSQSIRRRRSSSDLNAQLAASQPYPLATRVPECPQSFTSFFVIHFHFAYFPVCLFV